MQASANMRRANSQLQPQVWFLLGLAMAGIVFVFYQTANPMERALEILAWANGAHTAATATHGDQVAAGISKVESTDDRDDHDEAATFRLTPAEEKQFEGLAPLLARAASEERNILLTVVNNVWSAPGSLLDAFLESFHEGEEIEYLLKHLVVMTIDAMAFDNCKAVHPFCFFLPVDNINATKEAGFLSKDYIELVWLKIKFQRQVLQLGYNLLFSDVDIMWFRNPLKHVSVFADITISCDKYVGSPDDETNRPNTGLFFLKSSRKNIQLLTHWYEAKTRFPPGGNQPIFSRLRGEFKLHYQTKMQYFDTAYCGGFCNHGNDLNKICTMHANCCCGHKNKLQDLRGVLEDWKKYKSLNDTEKSNGLGSWSVPGKCIK